MLTMKIDLLKKFEDYSQDKAQMQTLQALETRMTCGVCGNVGHSGDNCPDTQEEALYINGNNNGFRPQGGQGWNQPRPYYQGGNGNSNSFGPNQPTLRDLVYGQAKIEVPSEEVGRYGQIYGDYPCQDGRFLHSYEEPTEFQ